MLGKLVEPAGADPLAVAAPGINREFDVTSFRYSYQSFTTPPSVYEVDLATRVSTLLKRTEVLGGYDPDAYVSLRLHATAPDGTKVPISLVHRRDHVADGSAPLLLYGYFGENVTEWGHVMAAAALTTLPTLLLFLPLQTRMVSGLAAGSVKQ